MARQPHGLPAGTSITREGWARWPLLAPRDEAPPALAPMITRLLLALTATLLVAAPARTQTYSAGPLRVPAAFSENNLPRDPGAFLEWLRSVGKLDPDRAQMAREHLYALIGARIKDMH